MSTPVDDQNLAPVSGLNAHRLSSNPDERVFAEAWAAEYPRILPYLLDPEANRGGRFAPDARDLTERDRQVAATIIQWLGSPVGRHFVERCLERCGPGF